MPDRSSKVTFEIESPMRAWRVGDYPLFPFVCVTVRDESGSLLESAQLMTAGEIDNFFGRITFKLKILPRSGEQSCEAAKGELAHQQARMRGHA